MDRPCLDPDTLGKHLEEPYRSAFLHHLFWGNLRWQGDNVDIGVMLRGTCGTYVRKFTEMFPELKEQPGFINFQVGIENYRPGEHYWCVHEDGRIIDPTLEQFYHARNGYQPFYKPLDEEKDIIQIGKCMNCGSEIYGTMKELKENGGRKELCDDILDENGEVEESCAADYERYMRREAAGLGR